MLNIWLDWGVTQGKQDRGAARFRYGLCHHDKHLHNVFGRVRRQKQLNVYWLV